MSVYSYKYIPIDDGVMFLLDTEEIAAEEHDFEMVEHENHFFLKYGEIVCLLNSYIINQIRQSAVKSESVRVLFAICPAESYVVDIAFSRILDRVTAIEFAALYRIKKKEKEMNEEPVS